jgi:5'-nucleotidase
MQILLTNDDGVHARGLWALYERLRAVHEVTVVAPDRERSAIGHAITLSRPLRAMTVTVNGGHQALALNGTPADCVKFGLLEVLARRPDLVVSGINPGANVGVNINYSGTVAAAKEAALGGVPAVAVSIEGPECRHLDSAAEFALRLAAAIQRYGLPPKSLLNVNLPDRPLAEVAGVRISRQGFGRVADYYEKGTDPRRRPYFWPGSDTQDFDGQPEADGLALAQGFISVTPLRCDMTDENLMQRLRRWPLGAD